MNECEPFLAINQVTRLRTREVDAGIGRRTAALSHAIAASPISLAEESFGA